MSSAESECGNAGEIFAQPQYWIRSLDPCGCKRFISRTALGFGTLIRGSVMTAQHLHRKKALVSDFFCLCLDVLASVNVLARKEGVPCLLAGCFLILPFCYLAGILRARN